MNLFIDLKHLIRDIESGEINTVEDIHRTLINILHKAGFDI